MHPLPNPRAAIFAAVTLSILAGTPVVSAQVNSTNIAGAGVLQPTASFAAIIAGNTSTNGGTNSAIIGAANASIPGTTRFAFIGAGNFNTMAAGSHSAAMIAGFSNAISAGGVRGATVGGAFNTNAGRSAVILGGEFNLIGVNSTGAAIVGGLDNIIRSNSRSATIGGGENNTASAVFATIPGGLSNAATGIGSFAAGVRAKATNSGSFVWNSDAGADFASATNNSFRVNAPGGAWFSHDVSVQTITIRGGADLAEPFETGDHPVEPGTVLVIDPDRPGHLMPSATAYDTRVAGVASGAAGINAGIILRQEGRLDRGVPVALSGRVYVNADADYGAIQPGDLLVTSDTPGHARRVSDHARANGAVLGKAMSSLPAGRGQVLVLVGLQ